MENRKSTGDNQTSEFVNLEEYNNLLCQMEHLEENQLFQTEISIKIKVPEIVAETIKLISNIFYRIPSDKYISYCVLSGVMADFDRLMKHHKSYQKLDELMEKVCNKTISGVEEQ